MADLSAMTSGLSVSDIGTGAGSGRNSGRGTMLLRLLLLLFGPVSTADKEETGGIIEAEGVAGKSVECDITGVTGEYGGRGGVPGASSSWLFSSEISAVWLSMDLKNFCRKNNIAWKLIEI